MLPFPRAAGHGFLVRRSFQGRDVIGESREGFLVLSDGRKVTPSLGMDRGRVDLADPETLRACGIRRDPASQPTRASAGEAAPVTMEPPGSAHPEIPRFEKRTGPAPALPGASELAAAMNADTRTDAEVLADLKAARARFGDLVEKRQQTGDPEKHLFLGCVKPMLNAMNARTPGLNAIGCTHEDQMVAVLRRLSGPGPEGHVRFHVGMVANVHSLAVDTYRHADGMFTLVAVDSISKDAMISKLAAIRRDNPGLIKGSLVLPTPNQVHTEGCRILAAHSLEAMHDYQPAIRDMHLRLAGKIDGKGARPPQPDAWREIDAHTLALKDPRDAFGLLAGKFFKHMQVPKPRPGKTATLLDEAEARNPALKAQAQNKRGETLRARFAGGNPGKLPEEFDRFDRTASADRKRLVQLDRAILHYEARVA